MCRIHLFAQQNMLFVSMPSCLGKAYLIKMYFTFGPRFQNWDLRIRPLGGNFTENQIFKSKIANSSAQRSKTRKIKLVKLLSIFQTLRKVFFFQLEVYNERTSKSLIPIFRFVLQKEMEKHILGQEEIINLLKPRRTMMEPKFNSAILL